jgi:hypothetical protein
MRVNKISRDVGLCGEGWSTSPPNAYPPPTPGPSPPVQRVSTVVFFLETGRFPFHLVVAPLSTSSQ